VYTLYGFYMWHVDGLEDLSRMHHTDGAAKMYIQPRVPTYMKNHCNNNATPNNFKTAEHTPRHRKKRQQEFRENCTCCGTCL
jgi:hypothetical protein